jgi:sulfur dioxygenase
VAITIRELNGTNCKTYLLVSGDQAALVDPVRERLDTYRAALAAEELQLQMIVETHMHADHLMVNRAAKELFGAPIYMHQQSPSPLVDHHLADGQELRLGDDTLLVLHTPGHTPDSCTLRTERAVLTGDTMLIGGSGRTDFPGGDAGAQYDAVVGRLFSLDDATVVWPGHDYKGLTSSTIGQEKRTNPRFLNRTRAEYITVMANLGLPFPEKIQQSLQVNQSGFEADEVAFPQVCDVAALENVEPEVLVRWLDSAHPPVLLDVREPEEFTGELGHIAGSLLVPLDSLARRLAKLHGYVDRTIVVVCRAGARSATAGAILRSAGFRHVKNLDGGMLKWTASMLPVQR